MGGLPGEAVPQFPLRSQYQPNGGILFCESRNPQYRGYLPFLSLSGAYTLQGQRLSDLFLKLWEPGPDTVQMLSEHLWSK